MKKLFSVILAFCTACLCLCSCSDNNTKISDEINRGTTFELNFLEDVEGKDLSSLVPEYGWFGAEGYYNSGYKEGDEYYVRYIITAYPDYADGGRYVTSIECTDPNVKFFGNCTVNDCNALFQYLQGEGFVIAATDDYPSSITSAGNGKITVTYNKIIKSISFSYDVENRDGIVF